MLTLSADDYEGWEIYPQSLSVAQVELDASRSNRRISQLSKELFVANDESEFAFMSLSACKEGTYPVSRPSALPG